MEKTIKGSLIVVFGVLFLHVLSASIDFKLNSYKSSDDVQVVTLKERERQLDCLTKNIYYEAATEPFEGKVGVAQVTLNRAESGKFPNDICRVVYQKNIFYDKVICQFSWYCEERPKAISKSRHLTKTNNSLYNDIRDLALYVYLNHEEMEDPSRGALFYHADYVSPGWRNMEKTNVIGRHIFYIRKDLKST